MLEAKRISFVEERKTSPIISHIQTSAIQNKNKPRYTIKKDVILTPETTGNRNRFTLMKLLETNIKETTSNHEGTRIPDNETMAIL